MYTVRVAQPTEREMLDMEHHDVYEFGKYRVIRVPGGWIYERKTRPISKEVWEITSTFVPYERI